jgi:hypothetical protein
MNDRESIHNGIAHGINYQRAGCCWLLLAWLGYGFTWAYGVKHSAQAEYGTTLRHTTYASRAAGGSLTARTGPIVATRRGPRHKSN